MRVPVHAARYSLRFILRGEFADNRAALGMMRLRPVGIHRELMTAAAMWIMAAKL